MPWPTRRKDRTFRHHLRTPRRVRHLIVAHDVIDVGNDRAQLASISNKAKAVLGAERLDVAAGRGTFGSEEIPACDRAGITVTLPKPQTSIAKAQGRFGTIKAWMGTTHYPMKRLKNVCTEMALSVLAYNLTRVMNIIGIRQ